MAVSFSTPPFAFIIDTDTYAGNFERELYAFITGSRRSKIGDKETRAWFQSNVVSVADENGSHRPFSIWPTPGWFNDGMGSHWPDGADPEAVRAQYEATVRQYHEASKGNWQTQIDILEGRSPNIFVLPIKNTVEVCQREIQRIDKQTAETIARGPNRFPAYLSVAIFLGARPPKDILALMQERARMFQMEGGAITGFRLISLQVVATDIWSA